MIIAQPIFSLPDVFLSINVNRKGPNKINKKINESPSENIILF